MLGISGTRRPGCQELSWKLESSTSKWHLIILPPTPGVSNQLEVPNSSPEAPTQTPVKTSPLGTRPVRKRVRPGYLKDYLCEL